MMARIALPFVALFTLLLLPAARLCAQEPNASLENEFIRLVVNRGPNEAGRFSIITTGGDPARASSKGQQLIYGGNTPWTSFTTVRLDGTDYVFGGPTARRAGQHAQYGEQVAAPAVKDGAITCAYRYGDIVVTQELGFVRGSSSRMLDTLGITYRVSNQGKTPHQVGIRVLLDTKLGANDGAPFRVGVQSINTATILPGQDLPDYWQAFDSLDNPNVISQGTFAGSNTGATKPDRVVLADWGTLADDIWEPTLDPRLGFHRKGEWDPEQPDPEDTDSLDTATALYWHPVAVDPGKSASVTTNYGIGYINGVPGQLSLGITAPAETTFEYERTQPFTVTGYLRNSGGFEARNVTFSLKLPTGLALVSGSKASQTLDTFKPGEEVQASWVVVPTGKASGKAAIRIDVSSDNVEANKASWDLQVNVPKPRLVLSPNAQRVQPKTNKKPTLVPININLSPAVEFYGAQFTLTYDPAVMKPLRFDRGSALVDNGRLLDGWEYDDTEDGKIVITASRGDAATLTQAEINLATVTFRVVGEGSCPLELQQARLLNAKEETSPVATSAGSVDVKSEIAQ